MEGLKVGNRRIRVENIENNLDGYKEVITFEETWFLMNDTLVNQRTGNRYHIDAIYRSGKRMDILGHDEYTPFDIKIGDLFYKE